LDFFFSPSADELFFPRFFRPAAVAFGVPLCPDQSFISLFLFLLLIASLEPSCFPIVHQKGVSVLSDRLGIFVKRYTLVFIADSGDFPMVFPFMGP